MNASPPAAHRGAGRREGTTQDQAPRYPSLQASTAHEDVADPVRRAPVDEIQRFRAVGQDRRLAKPAKFGRRSRSARARQPGSSFLGTPGGRAAVDTCPPRCASGWARAWTARSLPDEVAETARGHCGRPAHRRSLPGHTGATRRQGYARPRRRRPGRDVKPVANPAVPPTARALRPTISRLKTGGRALHRLASGERSDQQRDPLQQGTCPAVPDPGPPTGLRGVRRE